MLAAMSKKKRKSERGEGGKKNEKDK